MLSLSTKGKGSRFSHKLDKLFWWIVALLPVFIYVLGHFRDSNVSMTDFLALVPTFPFIQETLDEVCTLAFGHTFQLNVYLAYLVGVEILHVLFDVIVFIPRFAHKLIDKSIDFD